MSRDVMESHQDIIKALLTNHIMFNQLSAEDRNVLEGMFDVEEFEPGQIIAEQFTPMPGMYNLYSGKILVKQTVEGRRIFIDEMSKGWTFGELSLVKGCNWEYRLVAGSKVVVFILRAEKVHEYLETKPALAEIFKKHVGQIQLGHRLKNILGSGKYTSDQFSEILNSLGIKRVPNGTPLFSKGDNDSRLYYIEEGTVDLISSIEDDEVVLDRCTRGELIGEVTALSEPDMNGGQPYTALAVTDVTVLVIQQPEVRKILSINANLHNRLQERARDLKQTEREEVEALSQVKAVYSRIKLADAVTEKEFLALEEQKDFGEFPIVRQGDESECGAACLTMVTRHYGKSFNLEQIKELSNMSSSETTLANIINGAESLGYGAKACAPTFDDLKNLKLPGIVGWEGNHYAVVYRVDNRKVYLADPLQGQKTLTREEFITGWTRADISEKKSAEERGLFIALNPTVKFENLDQPKKPIYHFVRYLTPHKKFFLEAFIASLIINLLVLATPLFVQTIVDTVVVHKDVSLLNIMLGGMALVSIFMTLTRVVQRLLLAHTTARIDMRLMSDFYRHILSLPISFFLTRNKGEILARFGENTKIRAILTGSTITVILNALLLAIYFLMMFAYSSKLSFIVIAFIPGYIGLILYFTPRIKAFAQKIFLANSQSQAYLIEALNGIETIKATSNEYMARSRWENAFVENVNNAFRQAKLILMSSSSHDLLRLASNTLILWYGANQVIDGNMSIGELMGFNMLVGLVMVPIQEVVQLWDQFQEVRISIDRVSDILNIDPEQEPVSSPDKMPVVLGECQGKIEFAKVNFTYVASGKENHVMKDFDLVIEPGQHIALVGPSGCGKSTIAKMILGFNIPKTGECKVDGRSILDLDLASLRKHIGMVLQDSFLISGTVAENIALGDPEPDMMAVKRAAKLGGIHGEIVKWPIGYRTPIGEKGMGISGGQRQRVCIARALYKHPKILIFDEATSALDSQSEKIIQAKMRDILKGRTSITIAHRLSTIVDADMICYISDGKVAEKGTHKELTDSAYLKKRNYTGKYYKLAQEQFNLPPLGGRP